MAAVTVTYAFSNSTTADATQVNTNFTDIVNGLGDGTKDLTISAITAGGNAAFNANTTIGNAVTDQLTVTARLVSDVLPLTTNTYDLGSAALAFAEVRATNLYGTVQTAAQGSITSVGTLTSLTVTGNLLVDTDTLYVDAGSDEVGVNTNPSASFHVRDDGAGARGIVLFYSGGESRFQFEMDASDNSVLKLRDNLEADIVRIDAGSQSYFSNLVKIGADTSNSNPQLQTSGDVYIATTTTGNLSRACYVSGVFECTSILYSGASYTNDLNGTTYRDLLVRDTGEFGYDSSARRYKTNIKKSAVPTWLESIDVVDFQYKKKKEISQKERHEKKIDRCKHEYLDEPCGKPEMGMIAEDLEKVCPQLVFHDDDGQVEGIHHKRLVYPLIAYVQHLNERLKKLESA